MEVFLSSTAAVAIAEIGDKTRERDEIVPQPEMVQALNKLEDLRDLRASPNYSSG